LVTCAGTGKAPTCVLHHAKPWDYTKPVLPCARTPFAPPTVNPQPPSRIREYRHPGSPSFTGDPPWPHVPRLLPPPAACTGTTAPCCALRPCAWPSRPMQPAPRRSHRLRQRQASARSPASASASSPSATAAQRHRSSATGGCTANARACTTQEPVPDTPGRPEKDSVEPSGKKTPRPGPISRKPAKAAPPLESGRQKHGRRLQETHPHSWPKA
jgi:hypothetical protein